MLRVSLSTSSFSELMLLNPREATAQLLELRRATWMPGTPRNASGKLVAPERRMSSCVTTAIAAAAPPSGSAVRETDVTSIWLSSRMLSFFRSLMSPVAGCANPGTATSIAAAMNARMTLPNWYRHPRLLRCSECIKAAFATVGPAGLRRLAPPQRRAPDGV
jgi:hypothetical protein